MHDFTKIMLNSCGMKKEDLECEFMRRELMHESIAREISMNSTLPRALPRSREIRTRSHEIDTHDYTPDYTPYTDSTVQHQRSQI